MGDVATARFIGSASVRCRVRKASPVSKPPPLIPAVEDIGSVVGRRRRGRRRTWLHAAMDKTSGGGTAGRVVRARRVLGVCSPPSSPRALGRRRWCSVERERERERDCAQIERTCGVSSCARGRPDGAGSGRAFERERVFAGHFLRREQRPKHAASCGPGPACALCQSPARCLQPGPGDTLSLSLNVVGRRSRR